MSSSISKDLIDDSLSLAVIGLDALYEGCNDVEGFKQILYSGSALAQPETDFLNRVISILKQLGVPQDSINELSFEDRLLLIVSLRALNDAEIKANLKKDAKIAMIIQHSSFQPSDEKTSQRTSTVPSHKLITKLLNITGSAEEMNTENGALSIVLKKAQELVSTSSADTVLVCASSLKEGVSFPEKFPASKTQHSQGEDGTKISGSAAAVVLTSLEGLEDQTSYIYAQIGAASNSKSMSSHACLQTLERADIEPSEIDHVEICGFDSTSGEIKGVEEVISSFFESEEERNCSLGSIQANIGHALAVTGISSLIKVALSLNNRTLYAYPGLDQHIDPQWLKKMPFYCLDKSQPWFLKPYNNQRAALVCLKELDKSAGYIVMSKKSHLQSFPEKPIQSFGIFLFPVFSSNPMELQQKLDILEQQVSDCDNLSSLSLNTFSNLELTNQNLLTPVLMGHNKEELIREIQYARKGLIVSLEKRTYWQTPLGSFFTPKPLGQQGKVAFVYPGAFNSFIGLGRELFYLLPQLHERVANLTADPGRMIHEDVLYPRNIHILDKQEVESLHTKLVSDPIAMLSSGAGISFLFTVILREIFKVQPQIAFGYSLGENSMMFALGVWSQGDAARATIEASPLFYNRLAGPQNSVREHWGLPTLKTDASHDSLWENYILMTTLEQAKRAIEKDDRVYITHINTPRQIVIGGEKKACQRIIASLNCMYLKAPYDYVLHSDVILSEFDTLVRMNNWPVENIPTTALYTAANYQSMMLDSNTIAKNMATMLCNRIDFPRLVDTAYEDGARVFIELGAGSNCTKWIDSILKEKSHLATSINRVNVEDHVSIYRLLAKLISHQVPVDLSPLFLIDKENQLSSALFNSISEVSEQLLESNANKTPIRNYL